MADIPRGIEENGLQRESEGRNHKDDGPLVSKEISALPLESASVVEQKISQLSRKSSIESSPLSITESKGV